MAKNGNQPATKKELRQRFSELRQEIRKVEQKMDVKFRAQSKFLGMRIDFAVEQAEQRIEERAQKRHDQMMTTLDQFVKEIRTAEEERAAIAMRLSNHEERIQNLETVVAVDKSQTTGAK